MKIKSIDNNSWITINYSGDSNYSSYQIEALVDIGHGHFTAKNIDQVFLNTEAFLEVLERFITDRSLTPKLYGTYDTYLKFYSTKKDIIMIEFSIGDSQCGHTQTIDYSLNGAFEITQEDLMNLAKIL